MSLLSIVQGVAARLALPQPPAVVASADRQVQQLLGLANEAGAQLGAAYPWQALRREQSFVSTATQAQAAALPADFGRFVPNSFFNRSTRRPITGPITPRQHQWLQAQPAYSSVYLAFVERTGQFLIDPNPAAGQTIAYEYLSNAWARSSAGVPQTAFLADADTALLDEELIALGLKWRFLRAKGLDYAEEMATCEREAERAQARDGGATALTLAPAPVDPDRLNLPDGNYGG
ncbi:MAG TPA: hypothetical protein VMU93_07455 [Caulobacteraceae bacterium]|nr:hypothetical protein [Caulobacteraceae bacterium]